MNVHVTFDQPPPPPAVLKTVSIHLNEPEAAILDDILLTFLTESFKKRDEDQYRTNTVRLARRLRCLLEDSPADMYHSERTTYEITE